MPTFAVRIPDEISAQLEEAAEAAGLTKSDYVRDLLDRELNGRGKCRHPAPYVVPLWGRQAFCRRCQKECRIRA